MSRNCLGYGSLILPQSFLGRFDSEIKNGARKNIEKNPEKTKAEALLEYYTSRNCFNVVRDSEIDFIPVKISGLKRMYALEERTEGNMLTVVRDEDSWINGVIASGLTNEQMEGIAESEKMYRREKISSKQITSYTESEFNGEISVFVAGDEVDNINLETENVRDPHYHQFIIEGAKILGRLNWNNEDDRREFVNEFIQDFNQTTYERRNSEWRRLSEIE